MGTLHVNAHAARTTAHTHSKTVLTAHTTQQKQRSGGGVFQHIFGWAAATEWGGMRGGIYSEVSMKSASRTEHAAQRDYDWCVCACFEGISLGRCSSRACRVHMYVQLCVLCIYAICSLCPGTISWRAVCAACACERRTAQQFRGYVVCSVSPLTSRTQQSHANAPVGPCLCDVCVCVFDELVCSRLYAHIRVLVRI